jgi:hypothetical protein
VSGERLVAIHYGWYRTISGLGITLGNLATAALWDVAGRHHAAWLPWLTLTTTGLLCAACVQLLSRTGGLHTATRTSARLTRWGRRGGAKARYEPRTAMLDQGACRRGDPHVIRRTCATLGTALLMAGALATTPHAAAAAEQTCSYTSATERPTLMPTDTGLAVKQAQCLSNRWGGVPKLPVNGIFGPATLKKIWWIQGCHGLAKTGVIDQDTWQVLYHPALDCYDPYPQ